MVCGRMSDADGIFWVDGDPSPGVAIVLRPGWTGSLANEMKAMKRAGIDVLVSLQELDEAEVFGLIDEGRFAVRAGMEFLSFPIPDHHVPPDAVRFKAFIKQLKQQHDGGKKIAVHCQGSIGRATVTAACLLIQLGWEPRIALKEIESTRGCEIPDTPEQEAWILRYKAES